MGVIAVASIAGFFLALTISGNAPYAGGLFFLCVAWVVTTSMAVLTIRRPQPAPASRVDDARLCRDFHVRDVPLWCGHTRASQGLAISDAQAIMAWGLLGDTSLAARTSASDSPDCNPAGRWLVFFKQQRLIREQEVSMLRLLTAIALVLIATGSVHAAEKTLDRAFTVSPGGELVVDANSASVHVSGDDGNPVVVHMVFGGSESDLDDVKLDAIQKDNGVTVTSAETQDKVVLVG